MRKRKGIASIVEAMIVSIAIALLVGVAFTFFSSYLNSMNPQEKYVNIQAVLCGKVFVVKNVGPYPVKLDTLVQVGADDSGNLIESDKTLNKKLNPGESYEVQLDKVYDYVYIIGENFRSKPIMNDCVWITIVGGGNGGGGGGIIGPPGPLPIPW